MYKQFARQLFATYETFRVDSFSGRRFSHEQFHSILDDLSLPDSLCRTRIAGYSFEGRPIRLLTVGRGTTSILLWSQMHGDESTATMAIADILHYLNKTSDSEPTRLLLSKLTIHFLPMLNPDGAEQFQRRTTQAIDMNRDAIAFRTPEARILHQVQQELKPDFGFNLHDQELSTIGTSKTLTAIALLAPAYNKEKTDNPVRIRAKHLCAAFTDIMNLFIPGSVARYDDGFEPRAFGDNMQLWGTSTMLIESGHVLNDPEKWSIRKLNAVGILASLTAIAAGSYVIPDIDLYTSLPTNGKRVYDVIVRNVLVQYQNGKSATMDLGISYQVDTHSEEPPILVDAGDLQPFLGLQEIDAGSTGIEASLLKFNKPFPIEKFKNR